MESPHIHIKEAGHFLIGRTKKAVIKCLFVILGTIESWPAWLSHDATYQFCLQVAWCGRFSNFSRLP